MDRTVFGRLVGFAGVNLLIALVLGALIGKLTSGGVGGPSAQRELVLIAQVALFATVMASIVSFAPIRQLSQRMRLVIASAPVALLGVAFVALLLWSAIASFSR